MFTQWAFTEHLHRCLKFDFVSKWQPFEILTNVSLCTHNPVLTLSIKQEEAWHVYSTQWVLQLLLLRPWPTVWSGHLCLLACLSINPSTIASNASPPICSSGFSWNLETMVHGSWALHGDQELVGPWSNKGLRAQLVKYYKMLLLLQFILYIVDGVS